MYSDLLQITNLVKTADVLRLLIRHKKMTASAVANELGLNPAALYTWLENPDKQPREKSLVPYAEFFGVSMAQLRGYEPIPGVTTSDLSGLGIPILTDREINAFKMGVFDPAQADRFTPATEESTETTFAYVMPDDAMKGVVPQGAIVLIDHALDIEKYESDGNPLVMVEREGYFTIREEIAEMGVILYRPTNPNSRQLDHTECKVVGYVLSTQLFFLKKRIVVAATRKKTRKQVPKIIDFATLQKAKDLIEKHMGNREMSPEKREEFLREIYRYMNEIDKGREPN